MGTQHYVSAPIKASVVAALLVTACSSGGGSNVASHSPLLTASPTATAAAPSTPTAASTPKPLAGSYGVLVGSQGPSTYTVSIVGTDGMIAASAQASTPPAASCAGSAAASVPLPVSTSNSRVYYMDATGALRWVAPDGSTSSSPVMTLPIGPSTRSVFAVQPGGFGIAVAVIEFARGGAVTRLFVDNLPQSSPQNLIFTETGSYALWPIGWTGGGSLVVATVVSCTQGGGPLCCGPQELHVVNPVTAARQETLGGSGCVIAGPPSPAGVACETSNLTQVRQVNWTAGTVRSYTIQGPVGAYLSPDGANVAFVDNTGTTFTNGGSAITGLFTCTWMDDTHVLAGGDAQLQPRVANVSNGKISPVAAQGDCGGRIPGGL